MGQFDLADVQREYFSILEEFFFRVAGTSVTKFAEIDQFSEAIRANALKIGSLGPAPHQWFDETMRQFYGKHKGEIYEAIRSLGGAKLVLGGGSRFSATHLDATRKMLLYADTIIIPDPILPWLEKERTEERFRHVLMLKEVFMLLRLKPLVDAQLPYPAIVIFPSWEKSLEAEDGVTQKGIHSLATEFVSYYLGHSFNTVQDIASYAQKNEDTFLNSVESNRLFVAPGGKVGDSLSSAIEQWKAENATWKSPSFQTERDQSPPSIFVLLGILERLTPQYHLLENAEELLAQPMLPISQTSHYYSLCAKMYSGKLEKNDLLDPKTVSILRSLQHTNLQWLGDVPIDALTELRKNNENENFRRQLEGYTNRLHEATLDDIDRTAAEVGHGLSSLLASHQKEIYAIQSKYKLLHEQTAIGAWISAAAMFVPALVPYVTSLSVSAVMVKYGVDKLGELNERGKAAKSLMGVLTSAKESSETS